MANKRDRFLRLGGLEARVKIEILVKEINQGVPGIIRGLQTMLILPVLLFRRSIRRAAVSLCFFSRKMPGMSVESNHPVASKTCVHTIA